MKLFFCTLCTFASVLTWAQSGVSGQATIHLEDGGTLCNGAARVVALRVNVTGLTGSSGEPAGLNASLVQITLNTHAQAWYARTLDGSISSSWPFRAIATDTSQVVATGNLKVVGWAAGDTPNQDYLVAQLVFSGPETSTSGDVSLSGDSSLASKWWDDGSPEGDGPDSMGFQTGAYLSITIPAWPGLTLGEGCSFWLSTNPIYDFSNPASQIDIQDLVELVNCMPY